MCIRSHALSMKCQVIMSSAGHSRIVGFQYEICFVSPFWHLELGGVGFWNINAVC